MTVAIYIRVSTDEQAKDGFSISAQREKIKSYCQIHDLYDVKYYIDEGISAKDTNRPQLQTMIQHIKSGMIDSVLVYRLDRLTRSVLDLYKLLEVFEEYDCSFKSATEVYDTSSAMGRLFITLVAAMAQWERENLGERVRMGQIEKARQGKYSAQAPFGFDKVDDKLIVNDDQKTIVLDMIQKVKEGYSMRRLANYMNDLGIPPIRGYQWHITSILTLLKNPALYGAMRWRDELMENTHEGIISKDEHEHLVKLLHERQNKKKRNVNSFFVYQMKLICPKCGNHLTSERYKYTRKTDGILKEHNRYRCQPCALNGRKAISVSEKVLEQAFVDYMLNMSFKNTSENVSNEESQKEEQQTEKIQKQVDQVEKQRAKYQKAWANDLITDEEFSKRMEETKKLLDDLNAQLEEIEPNYKEDIDEEKIKGVVKDFQLNWSYLSPKEKHEFLNMFIESIMFDKVGRSVTVTYVSFY